MRKIAVVTGGASGIGRALCRRLAEDGAQVIVADRDADGAARVAGEIGGVAAVVDVSRPEELTRLVAEAGPVELFFSNAGLAIAGGVDAPDEDWDTAWRVNTMASVWAARAVLPGMAERGRGSFVITASAAGLLTNLGAAPYTVTKHAAVGLAEWLSITYGGRGVHVACLCPLGVNTPMLQGEHAALRVVRESAPPLEPEVVADAVMAAIAEKRFLILPHPEVAKFTARKSSDPEAWLAAMRRVQEKLEKKI